MEAKRISAPLESIIRGSGFARQAGLKGPGEQSPKEKILFSIRSSAILYKFSLYMD